MYAFEANLGETTEATDLVLDSTYALEPVPNIGGPARSPGWMWFPFLESSTAQKFNCKRGFRNIGVMCNVTSVEAIETPEQNAETKN